MILDRCQDLIDSLRHGSRIIFLNIVPAIYVEKEL